MKVGGVYTSPKEGPMKKNLIYVAISCIFASAILSAAQGNERGPNFQVNVQKEAFPDQNKVSDNKGFSDQGTIENQPVTDQKVMMDIQNVLKSSFKDYNINVKFENGVVTLTGMVKSDKDFKDIENAVKNVKGVTKVDNKLQVSPSATSKESK